MQNKKKWYAFSYHIILLFLIGISTNLKSQTVYTAIDTAKSWYQKGDYKSAYIILHTYLEKQKNQDKTYATSIWLAARLAYFNYNFVIAKEYYQRALKQLPNNNELLIDYGGFLMNISQFNKAIEILTPLQQFSQAKFYLAKTYYWNGDFKNAKEVINTFIEKEKEVEEYKTFLYEFSLASALHAKLNLGYLSDNQPLGQLSTGINLSKKFSNILHPSLNLNYLSNHANDTSNTFYKALVGNIFSLNKLKINTMIGIANISNNSDIIYKLNLSFKIANGLYAELESNKQPYLYTIASTKNLLLSSSNIALINIENYQNFSGKIIFELMQFPDNNTITNISAWILSPSITKGNIKAKIGYSFSSSNAERNTFINKNVAPVNNDIKGIYYPYFTPKNQYIHYALATLSVNENKSFWFKGNISVPIYAKLDNPYFFNSVSGVSKDYYTQTFSPIEAHSELGYKLSDRINIGCNYTYISNNFYSANYINFTSTFIIK